VIKTLYYSVTSKGFISKVQKAARIILNWTNGSIMILKLEVRSSIKWKLSMLGIFNLLSFILMEVDTGQVTQTGSLIR
jgi:hypothetical protein